MVTREHCFLTEESCPSGLLSQLLPAVLLGLLVIILVLVFFIRTKYKKGEFSQVWSCEVQTQQGNGEGAESETEWGGAGEMLSSWERHSAAQALVTLVSGDQVPSPDLVGAGHTQDVHTCRQNTCARKKNKNLKRILK